MQFWLWVSGETAVLQEYSVDQGQWSGHKEPVFKYNCSDVTAMQDLKPEYLERTSDF